MTAGPAVRVLPLAALETVAEGTAWLEFAAPPGAACGPGQFFMLSSPEPSGPVYLGRPFSIGDARDGAWRFLLRALGRGTAWMRDLPPGTPLRLVGPLGRPFERPARGTHRFVAGGIGLAPFFLLARAIRAEQPAARIELLYGERTDAAHVPLEGAPFDSIERFTDDGSRGRAGTVVDGAAAGLADPDVAWYGCGPHPMLAALAARVEALDAPVQFSLEERMACGFGVCQACVVPNRAGPPKWRLLCVDGPVVDPREVLW